MMADERGAVTVHAISVACMLLVVAGLMVEAGALIAMRHRSASAADLSALAASRASVAGEDGCSTARRVARANDARIVDCRMDADVATLTARTTSKRWWGHRWAAETEARAAPDFYLESKASP